MTPELAAGAASAGGVVTGAGRGVAAATGAAALRAMASGSGSGTVPGAQKDKTDYSESNFDKFSGYSERLFSDAPYDADDAEADKVYGGVDARMDQRTKRKREVREEEQRKRARIEHSRIADTFVDVKRELGSVSSEEWEGIPDIGDRSLRYKKKEDRYTPVPDSIVEMGRHGMGGAAAAGSIDPRGAGAGAGAASSGSGSASMAGLTDIRGFSEARGQMLSMKLDKISDSVTGQSVVDPQGYLTSLASSASAAGPEADIADVKKARLLMRSVTTTNPQHGPGWIAAARLEEQVRNLPAARKLIREGCERCPEDEDVWLEAARLQTPAAARAVLADAVKHLPHSVKVWMYAAELEGEGEGKKAVLRKALTLIPSSEKLWRAAISLEAPEDAKVMLARAVECVPASVDMWLALARLESYGNAQRVLNQARQAIPADPAIWIAAARLEEAQGHVAIVDKIIARALKSLVAQQVAVDREAWLRAAEEAEAHGAPRTAAAIVAATSEAGVEEVDRKRTWLGDAEGMEGRGALACARALYERLLAVFPGKEGIWQRAAALEKRHGSAEALQAVLARAVAACPGAEVLWLMAAKERWVAGDVPGARGVLKQAFAANPRSEAIWLAAAKLEWENAEMERARALLARARAAAPSARVALKSALLEREAGDAGAEEALLREGVAAYPTAPKLWMMLGQLYERVGGAALLERAREAYTTGLRACPHSVPLWLLAARLEERAPGGGVAKARTVLEAARLRNPRSPPLFLEAVRLERRAGQERLAENLLARALQECPASGVLWAEDILTAPRPAQKRKSVEAVRRCDNDAHVVLAVGLLFWGDRKHEKARKWLHRACALDPDLGDAWLRWYAFETQHGTAESRADVERRFLAAEPAHGERWQAVAKSAEARRLGRLEVLKLAVERLRAEEASSGLWDQKPAGLGFVAGGAAGAPDAEDGEGAGAGAGAAAGAAASSSSSSSSAAPSASSSAGAFSESGAALVHGDSTWVTAGAGAPVGAGAGAGAASRSEPSAAPYAIPGDASRVHSDANVTGGGERMDEGRGGPP